MSQSTELMIDINVQDGASPKFKAIGQAAQGMGQQAEQAGGRAGGAFRRLQDAAKQNAVAIGLLTGSFGLFARSARDAERELMTLDRTYGETADSLRDFGDELQRTTAFSSEQAVEAANVFGTLSRNYGLTADQIQNLITVSADLAAVNGISLSDAAERVQAAIRGEAESAEALGLTMNETAIGLADVSAGMTEAEKAAYRYDALLEQAAFSTGAAADQADTTAGRMTQLTNRIQDAGRSFVEFTGPVGSAVAGLSDMSMEAGMAISGFAAMAPVLRTVITAVGGLSTAMGPIGLALAATAAVVAFVSLGDETKAYVEEAAKAEAATGDFITRLRDLALARDGISGFDADVATITAGVEKLSNGLTDATESADKWTQGLAQIRDSLQENNQEYVLADETLAGWNDEFASVVTSTNAWTEAAEDNKITVEEWNAIIAELESRYIGVDGAASDATRALALNEEILALSTQTGADTAAIIDQLANAWERFTSGEISSSEFVLELERIRNGAELVDTATAKTNQRFIDLQTTMTDAWTSAMDPLKDTYDLLEMIFSSFAPGAYEAQQSINGVTGAAQQLSQEMEGALGDPIATQQAIDNFYATASAMEILNYELALAGDNQEAINEAYRMFAVRVNAAAVALRGMPRASFTEDIAIADQQRQFEESGRAAADFTRELYAGDVAITRYHQGLAALDDPLTAQQRQMEANGRAAADYGAGMDEAAAATAAAEQAFIDAALELGGFNNALQVFVSIGAGTTVEQIGDGLVNVARAAYDAQTSVNALASGFQTLVQNPINWGKQAQEVADWATSMMLGADGVNSLADLWGRGQIETITYNRGLEAQGRILDANADIQNDVARIQAKQLPIMADLIENQAQYIDQLADLDPANQTLALGYMDVTKAAQAQNLVMLAADAASGQYGQAGLDLATNLITAAAMADPVLAMMLEDLDLITQYTDENGDQQIRVNFPDATSLNKDIQELTKSIDALTIALGGVPAHVNSTVDVIYRVNGVPTTPGSRGFGFTQELATGGTVTMNAARSTPMFATAATGRTTLVGEAGPELVTLPSGSQVTSSPATMDRLRSRPMQGSGGGVYFYGPVTLQPASTDVESAIRREALSGSRGY